MPRRSRGTVFRSPASQHPTCHEPRHAFAGSYDPDRSYHGFPVLSPDRRVETPMRPPGILSDRECFAGMGGIEENAAQPRRIAPFETECLAEYPGFMPTARVYQAQAIILDLADIENGLIAARKASRHRGRLASRRFG